MKKIVLLQAIHDHCRECLHCMVLTEEQQKQPRDCDNKSCKLYPVRPFLDPDWHKAGTDFVKAAMERAKKEKP